MIKLAELLSEKHMTAAQKKKRGEIFDKLVAGGMEKSKAGAIGAMQLMPNTAKELNIDPMDPAQNIKGGVSYFKQQMDKYKDPYLAAIAYNAGPSVADKFISGSAT